MSVKFSDGDGRSDGVATSPPIPAHPYPFPGAGNIALVVIDMQRDFLEPGGFGAALGNDVTRLQAIVPTLARLIAAFRAAHLPIVHTKEGHRADLSDCPPAKRARGRSGLRIGDKGPMGRILILGEPGNDFVAALAPGPGELVLPKPGKGAFYATDLDAALRARQIQRLVITGVTTEVCVQTTMREANDRGYDCLLVEDATESYFPEFKAATLAMVAAQDGIVGWTTRAEAVIDAIGSPATSDAASGDG
jgi:nicotinamidase-related amidase